MSGLSLPPFFQTLKERLSKPTVPPILENYANDVVFTAPDKGWLNNSDSFVVVIGYGFQSLSGPNGGIEQEIARVIDTQGNVVWRHTFEVVFNTDTAVGIAAAGVELSPKKALVPPQFKFFAMVANAAILIVRCKSLDAALELMR